MDVAVYGADSANSDQFLIAHGADRVFVARETAEQAAGSASLPDLDSIAKDANPVLVAFSHTVFGADMAPRLAFRWGVAVATDCIAAEIAGGELLLTRPCFGGKAHETFRCLAVPGVATFKSKVRNVPTVDPTRVGQVILVEPTSMLSDPRVTSVARETRSHGGQRLQDAAAVIGVGAG